MTRLPVPSENISTDRQRISNRMQDDLAIQIIAFESEVEHYAYVFSPIQHALIRSLLRQMEQLKKALELDL